MRISDWRSDVCSSDLDGDPHADLLQQLAGDLLVDLVVLGDEDVPARERLAYRWIEQRSRGRRAAIGAHQGCTQARRCRGLRHHAVGERFEAALRARTARVVRVAGQQEEEAVDWRSEEHKSELQ